MQKSTHKNLFFTKKSLVFTLCAAISLTFCGCKLTQTTLVPKADMEHLSTYKCVNFMGWAGNTYEVSTPGSISKTAIQDECTLQKIEGNKVTFDLIIRSHTAIDQDFARYMVKLNGKMIAPIIKEQSMEVRDYAYTGEYTVAALRTITGAGTFDLNITKPEEYIFRVIERKITVVGVVEAMSDEISIDISIPVEWNTARLGEVFKFKMM